MDARFYSSSLIRTKLDLTHQYVSLWVWQCYIFAHNKEMFIMLWQRQTAMLTHLIMHLISDSGFKLLIGRFDSRSCCFHFDTLHCMHRSSILFSKEICQERKLTAKGFKRLPLHKREKAEDIICPFTKHCSQIILKFPRLWFDTFIFFHRHSSQKKNVHFWHVCTCGWDFSQLCLEQIHL